VAATRPPRGGLGRGLGSLIGGPAVPAQPAPDATAGRPTRTASRPDTVGSSGPDSPAVPAAESAVAANLVAVPGATYLEVPVDAVTPNPRQPRTVFDEDALEELVHSIKEIGLLQPIVVRRAGEGYELIAGERRWRATQRAGMATIPAIIRDTSDDALLRDALLENLHRAQLNPLEEAAAYQQLLDDFGCTQEELATRIGRSRPQVSNTLRLLRLPPAVARRVAVGVLSAGHAKVLLSLHDEARIESLAGRVVAEGISVRALEEIVSMEGDDDGAGDDSGEASQRLRRRAPVAPGLASIAERLSDQFETRVRVDMGRSKGRITIEFATLEDLQRVLSLIERLEESVSERAIATMRVERS
jgi:ParB family transcriptional regulator, chromosome partitioning protein